ncbi:hypothetical protein K8R66_04345, partial [bacterium]|nr:hypothetical protein [bacterium]
IFASDGFFPFAESENQFFREGPEELANAGCVGGIVPADGMRIEEIKKFFLIKKNLTVVFVKKEFRGFCRH